MKIPIANRKCLILVSILLVIGTRGISYGQAADATLNGLTVSPVDIASFSSDVIQYHVGVGNSVTQVTITATATDAGATIQIGKSVTDRNTVASGTGQVVSLDEGMNLVFVWVTAVDRITTKGYTIRVGRSVTTAYGWNAVKDFNTLRAAGNRRANGIWSDGTTMWVADREDDKLYAYNMQTKARDAAKDFNTLAAAGNGYPQGIWSDGTTMWVADLSDRKLYAYNMQTKARDASRDIDRESTGGGNLHPTGIWSNGTIMWVAYSFGASGYGKLLAHNIEANVRNSFSDFNTLAVAGNEHPADIWSDGNTMWVSDTGNDQKLYAYSLRTKERLAALDFNTLKDAHVNIVPTGIWSDGLTMWVADANGKIFSFNMPARLSGLAISPVDISGFSARVTSYHLGVTNEVTQVTITPTANHADATIAINDIPVASGSSLAVSLSEGANYINITVALSDNVATTYNVLIEKGSGDPYGWKVVDDFNGLIAAGNTDAQGLWSDGETMWVADRKDQKIYAYNMETKKRDLDKEFDTLKAAGNEHPTGIWSDGETMWVADTNKKIYAYDLATKERRSAKDFDLSNIWFPLAGLWSDGKFMYVVYYTMASRYGLENKVWDRDFASVSSPFGIWSDGETLWISSNFIYKLNAFNLATNEPDPDKDFNTLEDAGNIEPYGIWSDGSTMWVASLHKIFSYNMPSTGDTTAAATDFNGDGKTDFVDFFLFADAYGGTDPRFDLDGNGTVDFVDFFKFIDAFGS